MAPKRKDKAPSAGREQGTPNYVAQENLAIALAALEASELKQQQTGVDLSAEAAKVYAKHLDDVVAVYGWPTIHVKKTGQYWKKEDSVRVRGQPSVVWTRWTDVIKPYCLNTIQALI